MLKHVRCWLTSITDGEREDLPSEDQDIPYFGERKFRL